ncbi:Restriction endonuclease [uncultured archaeon]|nr:Restriction endonuclease [uncultured archaeon]
MSRKRTPNWEVFTKILLKQAGIRTPRSFLDLLHFIQQNLPKDTLDSNLGKPLKQMTGSQFEAFLQWFFEQQGYETTRMKKSHDKGGDLLIRKLGETLIIQAKRRTQNIGIPAIQEVYAASGYYQATRALVITTSRFTQPALDLASKLGVECWDWERLLTEVRNHNVSYPIE